jgi:hypothetical protein
VHELQSRWINRLARVDEVGFGSSYGKRARSMVALARNLHLPGSCFLTGLTAVFVAALDQAPAGQMRAFVFLTCSHHFSPYYDVSICEHIRVFPLMSYWETGF